ncbi:type II toxin-antitoxin system RelE/ParE family toxin [Mesorhizobium microcysteis]|uniref:Type II toxin-antitoxin system RelE/ParE family toxin n=1 Tax=Neoaquamicrobium microcysteis TaxID=2682781 RepID=A0A5D4GWJ3_9HYPH|nr:type II toxin-antitoxin system RelE/ParE family toxin [Mesorhizobium microcysteis]TYR32333.1 type II toxin-antitoxin system RelE/ParE family toxin [Mesorhizobium microcysteis]
MKRRAIIISPEADADLVGIEEWLVEAASIDIAEQFIARIFAFCEALDIASQRGHGRDDIRPGLRIVGFERRLTIAFAVHDERVEILRIFRAGRDWEADLSDD